MPRHWGEHVLDQLLSLDVGHAVDTGDTITIQKLNQFLDSLFVEY
jgi:hypothetical protein